ncbi:hypothetical protein F5B22DRAFT_646409 [Xylaria bambusicola]|uniref:uncharacterized protein n=1 Tax=Xylaria bambusicola TaxID=326684 RepID=UPI0020079540|nr:uncharacterized protein F5B22DRAFT_646409 [Xylaria bambusicola]KAI0517052.1 hypothetical protein F5B22DRAFT_646409 [Xylaria bambusicola]
MPKKGDKGAPGFRSRMIDIRRRLEKEDQGRDQELPRVMRTQFSYLEKTLKPRENPLCVFQWMLFEGVSNYFWPGSVRPGNQPSSFRSLRPYVNVCQFFKVDPNVMPFPRLVEFVQHNGDPPFGWAKKPKKKLKQERLSRQQMNASSNNMGDPIVLHASSIPSPRPVTAQCITITVAQPLGPVTVQTNSCQVPRLVLDDGIEMTIASPNITTFAKPKVPTLSFACRPGFLKNKKENWVPAAGITPEPCGFVSEPLQIDRSADQQSATSVVSFTRASEKDVEAFLKSFLRREEDMSSDLNETS